MSSKTKQKTGAMQGDDNKPVPCGYAVGMGVCSIPNHEGRQPFDCANCNTGTDQNKRAIAEAKGKG